MERYGEVKDIETYCKYAQVVNYDQYRSFMEGWGSHLWDWYTGILIWKTQNPWTSLRGQMYDWFLDVNASLYGTRKGCEPLHPFYNPVTRQVELLNTSLSDYPDLIVNQTNYSVIYKGSTVDMPPKELELLYFLASSPNQVFTREQLLDHIWGYEYIGDTRTVDVHIKRLREKIKGNDSWALTTVWGIGYKFEVKNI